MHNGVMGLTATIHRRSPLIRALVALLVLAFVLPSFDADARRKKRRKKRKPKRPTMLIITSTTERAEVELVLRQGDGLFVPTAWATASSSATEDSLSAEMAWNACVPDWAHAALHRLASRARGSSADRLA